jgi:DNA-binding response OmpR family regulator
MQKKITMASVNKDLIEYLENELTHYPIVFRVEKNNLSLFKNILKDRPDILIIDDNFPNKDEQWLAKFLLINPDLIIIYLSSDSTENQIIQLLRTGVERVINKPVNNLEVLANIEAVIKLRTYKILQNQDHLDGHVWKLVRKGWKLIAPNQVSVDLTIKEYTLLEQLFLNPGEPVLKNHLAEKAIGKNIYNANEKLNKLIAELRKKILVNLKLRLPVKTIHTVGYAFDSEAVIVE